MEKNNKRYDQEHLWIIAVEPQYYSSWIKILRAMSKCLSNEISNLDSMVHEGNAVLNWNIEVK